jgi:hypothetical protein
MLGRIDSLDYPAHGGVGANSRRLALLSQDLLGNEILGLLKIHAASNCDLLDNLGTNKPIGIVGVL